MAAAGGRRPPPAPPRRGPGGTCLPAGSNPAAYLRAGRWPKAGRKALCQLNDNDFQASGRVAMPDVLSQGTNMTIKDVLSGDVYERNVDEV